MRAASDHAENCCIDVLLRRNDADEPDAKKAKASGKGCAEVSMPCGISFELGWFPADMSVFLRIDRLRCGRRKDRGTVFLFRKLRRGGISGGFGSLRRGFEHAIVCDNIPFLWAKYNPESEKSPDLPGVRQHCFWRSRKPEKRFVVPRGKKR